MSVEVHTLTNGPLKQQCYIAVHSNANHQALIIDPGSEETLIQAFIETNNIQPIAIINTHGHFDHIGAVKALQQSYQIPFFIHKNEKKLVRRANLYTSLFESQHKIEIPQNIEYFDDNLLCIDLAPFKVDILPTPGHTPGSVCFLIDDICFVGDTLFKGHMGRTDLPGGDKTALVQSLSKLFKLEDQIKLYPGHGSTTTIGREKNLQELTSPPQEKGSKAHKHSSTSQQCARD